MLIAAKIVEFVSFALIAALCACFPVRTVFEILVFQLMICGSLYMAAGYTDNFVFLVVLVSRFGALMIALLERIRAAILQLRHYGVAAVKRIAVFGQDDIRANLRAGRSIDRKRIAFLRKGVGS